MGLLRESVVLSNLISMSEEQKKGPQSTQAQYPDLEPARTDELFTQVCDQLRMAAERLLHGQPVGHTLQPTALVNETYLKLFRNKDANWSSKDHLIAVAGAAMRQILIDHARSKQARKRKATGSRLPLDDLVLSYEANGLDLLGLDEALCELSEFDPQMALVVEQRCFLGLELPEIAKHQDISLRTLQRKWAATSAWLSSRLS